MVIKYAVYTPGRCLCTSMFICIIYINAYEIFGDGYIFIGKYMLLQIQLFK